MFTKALFIDHSLISENSLNEILDSFFYTESGNYASSAGAIHRQDIEFFGDSLFVYGHSGGDIGYAANVSFIENSQTIIIINYKFLICLILYMFRCFLDLDYHHLYFQIVLNLLQLVRVSYTYSIP